MGRAVGPAAVVESEWQVVLENGGAAVVSLKVRISQSMDQSLGSRCDGEL